MDRVKTEHEDPKLMTIQTEMDQVGCMGLFSCGSRDSPTKWTKAMSFSSFRNSMPLFSTRWPALSSFSLLLAEMTKGKIKHFSNELAALPKFASGCGTMLLSYTIPTGLTRSQWTFLESVGLFQLRSLLLDKRWRPLNGGQRLLDGSQKPLSNGTLQSWFT